MTQRREAISADLVQAAVRFERWRRSASGRRRIPDSLWKLAVDLAGEHGLSRTSAALKLDYYDLKKRAVERTALAQPGVAADGFVELNPAALAMPSQCTIEFEKPCGSRMRIELQGNVPDLDLEALGRSFWESR